MINWFNMPEEGLSNGGEFEIKELTATENKVYQKDGEVYNKVTVNVEGGGGSSDFSTANVAIINNSTYAANIESVLLSVQDDVLSLSAVIDTTLQETIVVVLYKTEPTTLGITQDAEHMSFAVTGDVVDDGDGYFIVSGNGSITITDAATQ